MKKFLSLTNMVAVLALIACSICISSFRQDSNTRQNSFRTTEGKGDEDTTPPRKRNRDADEFRLNKLDEAMRNLSVQMSKLDETLREIDFTQIQKQVDASLSKIDYDKIAREVSESIKKTDWDKVEREMKSSLEKLKNTDVKRVKEEIEKLKVKVDKERRNLHFDAEKMKREANKAMEKTRLSVEKARGEISNMKAFTDALEKDGLIDKTKRYQIQVQDGELYINGTKQSQEIRDKYRKFYRKDNFTNTKR